MTKKIYLETLKSVLGRFISHCYTKQLMSSVEFKFHIDKAEKSDNCIIGQDNLVQPKLLLPS